MGMRTKREILRDLIGVFVDQYSHVINDRTDSAYKFIRQADKWYYDLYIEEQKMEYPHQDDVWTSRRWSPDFADYIDLSGYSYPFCESI